MSTNYVFSADSEDPIDPETAAQLRLENDILKLTLQAEFGARFGTRDDIPPEIENRFLQDILTIERQIGNASARTVFELLGEPTVQPVEQLTGEELQNELDRLFQLLENEDITLVVMYEYPPAVIYRFITEELFKVLIEPGKLPGMITVFVYENYHPNHQKDLEDLTHEFLHGWKNLHWQDLEQLIFYYAVLPDGHVYNEADYLEKIRMQASQYRSLDKFDYHIQKIQFEWTEKGQGLAFSEGWVTCEALLQNGDRRSFDQPFKCFFSNTDGYWRISFFHLPGFYW